MNSTPAEIVMPDGQSRLAATENKKARRSGQVVKRTFYAASDAIRTLELGDWTRDPDREEALTIGKADGPHSACAR